MEDALLTLALLLAVKTAFAADNLEGASWRLTRETAIEDGVRPLDGSDGAITTARRGKAPCLANKPDAAPPAVYLYFDVDDARAKDATGAVYLVIEYFDEAPGGIIQVQYDSTAGDALEAKYLVNEDQWGGWLAGRKRWETAVYLLEKPSFRDRQNLGADFRIGGAPLFIRSIRLTHARPSQCDAARAAPEPRLPRRVKIGRGGQLIIGGFDAARAGDVMFQTRALRAAAPVLRSLAITSHEGYVRWNLCEPEPGQYDWSIYDAYGDIYKECGLKWVPFLIIGSAYSLPDWYYKQPGSQGYVCLEHGEESDVQSLWNPVLRDHVARFIRAFCDHYRDRGVIESILLGITGNYGEAIYIATGNDWTADIHGPYHTHAGFWAGDKYAVADFRRWIAAKYGNVTAVNRAWGASFTGFDAVKPFLRKDAPNDRAWLDFCDWYIGSMTAWTRFWLQETRKHFPNGDIALCTGGHAPPEHGANFGDQCKVAAEVGGGVRITNEGSDYRANFSLTRWVAAAGRQYGAYFSFEPAGEVNAEGVIARIYGAAVSGARGLHYYYPNLFGADKARENFVRWGKQFKQRAPVVEIAVYYPQTFIKLNGNDFLGMVQPLRDRFDFDYMSDEQILDGGLDPVKALILLAGNTSEEKVWRAITAWVRGGGLLLYADGMGRLRTVEGDESVHNALFAADADLGQGRVVTFAGPNNSLECRAFVTRALAAAPELSPGTRAMIKADGEEDNVFVSLCDKNELLWLNLTPNKVIKGNKVLAPYSISSRKIRRRY
jgi:hypothetical protein